MSQNLSRGSDTLGMAVAFLGHMQAMPVNDGRFAQAIVEIDPDLLAFFEVEYGAQIIPFQRDHGLLWPLQQLGIIFLYIGVRAALQNGHIGLARGEFNFHVRMKIGRGETLDLPGLRRQQPWKCRSRSAQRRNLQKTPAIVVYFFCVIAPFLSKIFRINLVY